MTSFSELNQALGLRELPLNYTNFIKLAYETFADERTLIFLDTNVLALPFRFHSTARNGFYSLLSRPISEGRLYVPAWVSNEFFHNSFKSKDNRSQHGLAGNIKNAVGVLPKQDHIINTLSQSASPSDLAALATKLGLSNGSEVLSHLGKMATDWNEAMGKIGNDINPDLIHAELSEKLHGCFLALDFRKHCNIIDAHADRRRANRIPPGLTDGEKGNAERRGTNVGNVDGDLALWLEVLEVASEAKRKISEGSPSDMPVHKYERVIIISQERKYDFLYAPVHRVPDAGTPVSAINKIKNEKPPISLVDPRLVSEFESRIGHRDLAFLNMESIADGWLRSEETGSDSVSREIKEFVLALTQQNDKAEKKKAVAATANEDGEGESKPEVAAESTLITDPTPVPQVAMQLPIPENILHAIPQQAMNDEKNYIARIPTSKYKDIIDALNAHNWYVQNPSVLTLSSEGLPEDLGTSFVIGRAIYQAADGSAWRADKFLQDFNSWAITANESEQAFLAGTVYEALFDPLGQRRSDPKNGNLQDVLKLLNTPRWAPAAKFISLQLQKSDHTHYWLPGEPYPSINVEVTGTDNAAAYEVTGAILKVAGFVDRQICSTENGSPKFISGTQLHDWIANHLLLPHASIEISFVPALPSHGKIIVDRSSVFEPENLRNPQRIGP